MDHVPWIMYVIHVGMFLVVCLVGHKMRGTCAVGRAIPAEMAVQVTAELVASRDRALPCFPFKSPLLAVQPLSKNAL
jgi:hypothetical protein